MRFYGVYYECLGRAFSQVSRVDTDSSSPLALSNLYSCSCRLSGPAGAVLDDDTIEVLNGHHADRIRLSGIDCPESRVSLSLRQGGHPPDELYTLLLLSISCPCD